MTDQRYENPQPLKDDGPHGSDTVDGNDPNKVEKMTKAGRDEIDPDEGTD